jgi:hypothetical protein
MDEEGEGLRIISWFIGLSGLALITSMFWLAAFWPFGIYAYAFLFPLFSRATEISAFFAFNSVPSSAVGYSLWIVGQE